MERLDDLEAFLAIAEKGSQTAAARHLRRSLQSINRSLAALEQNVGVGPVGSLRASAAGGADQGYGRFQPQGTASRRSSRRGLRISCLLCHIWPPRTS
nr:LysR family transcriptional regulator [Rhizobium sp. BK275]